LRIEKIKKCRFCKSKNLKKILSLGYQNLQGYFKDKNRKINPKLKNLYSKYFEKKFLKLYSELITK